MGAKAQELHCVLGSLLQGVIECRMRRRRCFTLSVFALRLYTCAYARQLVVYE
jgi:hypothetical protein